MMVVPHVGSILHRFAKVMHSKVDLPKAKLHTLWVADRAAEHSEAEVKRRLKDMAAVIVGAATILVTPNFATAQSAPDIAAMTKVTFLEATYMPASIALKIDAPLGACATGTLLRYYPQGADATVQALNIQAVFSLLLTAKVSNQNVILTGYSADCTVVRFVTLN